MGDGRYYTSEQFFNIILFTTLIIFVVITFMFNLYKVEKYKKYITALGSLLGVSLVSAFISEVAYSIPVIIASDYLKSIALLAYLIGNTFLLFKNKDDKNFIVPIYIILLLIPIVVIIKSKIEINITYILYVAIYIFISNRFAKYKVSSSVFADVKKLMLDYVFIISIHGDVIFRNDKTINLDIFKESKIIDVDDISEMFTYETTIRKAFSKQFIKVYADNDNILYFQYHKKEILDKGKLAGYILTFVDITNLISMLDELSENREKTKKINLELDKYKDIVYDIEKEKEINNLLDDIANNQQKSMYILKKHLEELDINDDYFLDDLDNISEIAKSNLSDVRAAVTSYIKYYE
ncbi:MAG: hypothetical protein N4A63_08975 [Vallitalea sp.]|jgi:hypothetical protein|nr:hypothetical protein [Vallitalea sp.]